MKLLRATLLIGALSGLAAWPAASQDVELQADPLFSVLFPPELIMQHRRAIGLTDEQRDAISGMIQEAQGRVVRLQWELLDEIQQLTAVLDRTRIDLDMALDRMDAVLDTERKVKQAHLELLVGVKNLLGQEQQATLRRLRGESASGRGSGPPY
jgi:Spy/CpxP family protein refolding chaperone